MDAIDISSDDSDLREIDNYTNESPLRDFATSQILPTWATVMQRSWQRSRKGLIVVAKLYSFFVPTQIVWRTFVSKVLLTGLFDGWTTQIKFIDDAYGRLILRDLLFVTMDMKTIFSLSRNMSQKSY